MTWRLGVDIGGTFTDVAMIDEASGAIGVTKVLTTPRDLTKGVMEAIRQGLDSEGIRPSDVMLLSHATTVVTNALLEGKGARAGLVATRGFRDVLELRRSSRSKLYDLFQDAPPTLVPRKWRFEITERIGPDGELVIPLEECELEPLIESIRSEQLETVAISFLFSFLDDRHERRVGERIRQALPDVEVFLSSEVLPEIREFERASTTAVCAYVGPTLKRYLGGLGRATSDLGLPRLHVMGSSGGILDVAEALRMPAMVVESGPAAGVVAAALSGRQLHRPNLISFDMGGTTAKASLIAGGEVAVTAEYEVGATGHIGRWTHGTGHPIRVPVIDLAEVSSGGGSVAWIDPGGALKVGPHSAGADPGPAAYGRGGQEPTVSDADVLLGYLDRSFLLGGALKIDFAAAERAIDRVIARPLGLSVQQAASRIVEVVNAGMAEALRMVSIERGHDPREFALIAFGGAGPVHAVALAEELLIPEVIVPPAPGAFSAFGLVATDVRRDYSRTLSTSLAMASPAHVAEVFAGMEEMGGKMLDAAKIASDQRAMLRFADVRYRRQAYELMVPIRDGPITQASLDLLGAAFHRKHEQTYGHSNPVEPVELVNLRLTATGRLRPVALAQKTKAGRPPRTREVWFPHGGYIKCSVYWRDGLAAGSTLPGPVVIESMDSTTVVPPGWTTKVDECGYLLIQGA